MKTLSKLKIFGFLMSHSLFKILAFFDSFLFVMILSSDEKKEPLGVSDLPEFNTNNNTSDEGQMLNELFMSYPLREAREKFERAYLISQMKKFDGNITQMAKFIKMERSALYRKLKSVGVSEN